MAGKASHIAGVVAGGRHPHDPSARPGLRFPSRIALPAFCAVPSNTPINRNGVRVIPSAGPYYVTSYTPGQGVVLRRNPSYHGSRSRHFNGSDLPSASPTSGRSLPLRPERAITSARSGPSASPTLSGPRHGWPLDRAEQRGSQARQQRYFVNPILELDCFRSEHAPAAVQRRPAAPSGQLRNRSPPAGCPRGRLRTAPRATHRPLPAAWNVRRPRRSHLSPDTGSSQS